MFGRKKQQEEVDSALGMGKPVPPEECQPIYDAAVQAHAAGRRIFLCAVIVAHSQGGALGLGGKKTSSPRTWDASELIESIEDIGWRLEDVDHVWQQTSHNASLGGAAMIEGLTAAHMRFRISEPR